MPTMDEHRYLLYRDLDVHELVALLVRRDREIDNLKLRTVEDLIMDRVERYLDTRK